MRQALYWAGAVVILVVWLSVDRPSEVGPDLAIYSNTIEGMRGGESYYVSMYNALSAINGPPTEARSYRLPTIFYVWRITGLSWGIVLAVIILTGWQVTSLTNPVIGVFTAAYLASLAVPPGVPALYGWVEFWALPFVLASIMAIRHDRWGLAAVAVLCGALVRETVAPVMVSGLVAAWVGRRSPGPWLSACLVWTIVYVWHLDHVLLSPVGTEKALVGTGGLEAAINMAAPALGVGGAVVVAYAVWHARFTAEWWLTLPITLGIPAAGLVASRSYWGILVFPVALVLAWSREQRLETRWDRRVSDPGPALA